MHFIKRIFFAIILITTIGFVFRGWIYRHLVTYRSVGVKSNSFSADQPLTTYIESNIKNQNKLNIKEIIKIGLSITSKQLNFTAGKNDIDPNKLMFSKNAHCVGYASFFATSCNYLLKKYDLSDKWTAKSNIGQLYFMGTNVHRYSQSPFFKDHDFVTIQNDETGEVFAVDPTLNDYLLIDFIKYTK